MQSIAQLREARDIAYRNLVNFIGIPDLWKEFCTAVAVCSIVLKNNNIALPEIVTVNGPKVIIENDLCYIDLNDCINRVEQDMFDQISNYINSAKVKSPEVMHRALNNAFSVMREIKEALELRCKQDEELFNSCNTLYIQSNNKSLN